ncbi:MAG: hypothetical protein M3083_18560 [Actinomycetota bacterium]|nr:hypothetical protein [Actinomycetota bacterium]
MGYREVSVVEIREVLRRWLRGEGLRAIDRNTGVDRKTVRRYVEAAQAVGVVAGGDESQLTDGVIGQVCLLVRPARPDGHGLAWESLKPHGELIKGWVKEDLTLVKIHILLGRRGVEVPYRTLHRWAVANAGYGRTRATVRVADGEPGVEVQVDFGRMGLIPDPLSGRRRVVRPDLHGVLQPPQLRVLDRPSDDRGDDRGVRGGVGVLRRGFQGRDSRLCSAEHNRDSVPDRVMCPDGLRPLALWG